MSYESTCKLILLGDLGVGKSSLLSRFASNAFMGNIKATVAVEYLVQVITVNDRTVKLQIWDTAGQEQYRAISKSYYKSIAGVVMVYDITNRSSFENIREWVRDVQQETSQNVSYILLGNKGDLEGRVVSTEEGTQLAIDLGMKFLETSAKDSSNINVAFHQLTSDILAKVDSGALISDANVRIYHLCFI